MTAVSPAADDVTLRLRAGRLSLAVGIVVFVGKLGAFAFTGSTAVLSDALESVVNVVAAGLLLWSLAVAARPADSSHPYGHGKVEFFSAGVEGTLIGVAAALIGVEAVKELLAGPAIRNADLGLLLVTALTGLNAALGLYLVRVGRRTHSLSLQADGQHVLADVVTSVGVVVGLGAVWLTGWAYLDPLVAIAVALNILRTGFLLLRQAVGGLMDEADTEILVRMAEALEQARPPHWIDVHGMRSWRSGHVQHADLHMAVPRYFDADRLHQIDEEVSAILLAATGLPGDVIVHFDPCRPRQCPGCAMPACPVRSAPFEKREPFSLERVIRGDETLDAGRPLPALGQS
jgi:cation diffusion facilitator family transporter